MLADVRAHYRRTGELDQERVCMNMLATRVADLRLDRCYVGLSLQGEEAGRGLFASRDIRAGELITLYPGDALLYWHDGNRMAQNGRVCSGVVFGAHIPDCERDTERVTTRNARQYELQASSTISCVGDPRLSSDPVYLGHLANDGSCCTEPERAEAYRTESAAAQNADHVTLEGCQLATQATRDIRAGEEVLVSYGEGFWLSHFYEGGVPGIAVPEQLEVRPKPVAGKAKGKGPVRNAPPTGKSKGKKKKPRKETRRNGRGFGGAV